MTYDCIIVGGGPAGLSAALILGRCLRNVLVIDGGEPRNRHSHAMHGYLTRDGIPPGDFLRLSRQELVTYRTVTLRQGQVVRAARERGDFVVECSDGAVLGSATLLLATGVQDDIPAIDGLAELYGKSVHHCPYCDAWEWRGQAIAVYAKGGGSGAGLAIRMTVWTDDVVLCSDGPAEIAPETRRQLDALHIGVRQERLIRLEGAEGCLERVVFDSGEAITRRALFLCIGQSQASDLADQLGCRLNDRGTVETGRAESTNVPGLFVCGDASKDAQFVVVAAAEGAEAAIAINQSLQDTHLATL